MNRRFGLVPLSAVAGAAIAVGAGVAAGATSSSGPAHARVVAQPALVKPFVAVGDRNVYDLIPGGNFAPRTGNWSLSGNAAVVSSGLNAASTGTHGLSLGTGASATSAAFPGGDVHTVRFYAQNEGSSRSTLQVSATIDENGTLTQVPLGTVGGSRLAPTPIITLPKSLQVALTRSDAPLRVTISARGANSHWLVKNVYVDPFTRCGAC